MCATLRKGKSQLLHVSGSRNVIKALLSTSPAGSPSEATSLPAASVPRVPLQIVRCSGDVHWPSTGTGPPDILLSPVQLKSQLASLQRRDAAPRQHGHELLSEQVAALIVIGSSRAKSDPHRRLQRPKGPLHRLACVSRRNCPMSGH